MWAVLDLTRIFLGQVTEGRASQPLDEGLAHAVMSFFETMLPGDLKDQIVLASSEAVQTKASLKKALGVQTFGFAAGHVSPGRPEMNQLSCFRWCFKGTREVALVVPDEVVAYLKASQGDGVDSSYHGAMTWVNGASVEELDQFLKDRPTAIKYGTVGPRDLLFVPAGTLIFHRVGASCDVLGGFGGVSWLGVDSKRLPLWQKEAQKPVLAEAIQLLGDKAGLKPYVFLHVCLFGLSLAGEREGGEGQCGPRQPCRLLRWCRALKTSSRPIRWEGVSDTPEPREGKREPSEKQPGTSPSKRLRVV